LSVSGSMAGRASTFIPTSGTKGVFGLGGT
jgi:hypothetical protein